MYRLLNKLFGWDYIQWSNSCASGIDRVHVDHNGKVFYWQYKTIKAAVVIVNPDHYLWLTCSPKKYFSGESDD